MLRIGSDPSILSDSSRQAGIAWACGSSAAIGSRFFGSGWRVPTPWRLTSRTTASLNGVGDAQALALGHHEAVQLLDLGPAAAHHVLQERRSPALPCCPTAADHVGLELPQILAARAVDDTAGPRCPSIGSTSWPAARATRITSARDLDARSGAAASGLGSRSCRSRSARPAGWTCSWPPSSTSARRTGWWSAWSGVTSFIASTRRGRARVSLPSSSPILKPTRSVPTGSVRNATPGSYRPAPIVMTQPSVRCAPATAATRSSLMPFWKSTMTPSGSLRNRRMNIVAHSVSYALDGQEDRVERLLNALGLVQVQRLDRHHVVPARCR